MHLALPLARVAVIVALAVAVSACSGGGVAGELAGGSGAEQPTVAAPPQALDWEVVSGVIDDEWPLELTIPLGWHVENDPFGRVEVKIRDHNAEGWLAPEPGDLTSIFTSMQFDTGCDGICAPTDWEARLNGPDGWMHERRARKEFLRDEPIPGGWVQVEPDGRDLEVVVILWDNAAARFLECEVEVDDDDLDRVDAFVDACGAATPGWFPG